MNLVALAVNAGLVIMVVLPALAALLARLWRGSPVSAARAGRRVAEVDDIFNPGLRRQIEQMEISAGMRIDAENGDGDPLADFPDPDGLRDQLDPEGIYEARRARASRNPG